MGNRPDQVMGLLSELESEVQRREDLDAEERRIADEREARYQQQIVPAVRRIYQSLDQLVQHLNYLKREREGQFELPGYGIMTGKVVPEFEVSLDESARSISIQLQGRYEIDRDANPIVEVQGDTRVRSLKTLLQDLRLAGAANVEKGPDNQIVSATFQVHGSMSLQAIISGALDGPDILLRFTNFDELGERHRRVQPGAVDDEFLDRLARFVAREDNALLTEDISSDLRRQLRRQVEMNRLKRKWEDKMTAERPAVPAGSSLKEGVGGMAKRMASLGSKLKFGR